MLFSSRRLKSSTRSARNRVKGAEGTAHGLPLKAVSTRRENVSERGDYYFLIARQIL